MVVTVDLYCFILLNILPAELANETTGFIKANNGGFSGRADATPDCNATATEFKSWHNSAKSSKNLLPNIIGSEAFLSPNVIYINVSNRI